MRRLGLIFLLASVSLAYAGDLRVPDRVVAGNALSIPTTGSGEGTFYLAGPAYSAQRKVQLGSAIQVSGDELRDAGRYVVVLEGNSGTQTASFFVVPAQASNLSFLARPSRVPAAARGVITGTTFVFDKYNNLVLQPTTVVFNLAVEGAPAQTSMLESKDGVAWTRMNSGRKAGAAQFVASTNDTNVRRVVQQVASDPCNLRFRAVPDKNGILVQTDPVRDCAGNAVPDGTIVTFTEVDASGAKSTIDARIKRGIAQAQLPNAPRSTISVASGVVVGNEVQWRGGE